MNFWQKIQDAEQDAQAECESPDMPDVRGAMWRAADVYAFMNAESELRMEIAWKQKLE